jgi:hypothetical protein
MMNTGFRRPSIPFRSIHRLIQSVLPQLSFSFYRHQPIRADFSGGQITSDAGLLPLRAFDQRHHLSRDWVALLRDPRQQNRVEHASLSLFRQRLYQIVAGYEDANDADRLRHDPLLQIVADEKLGTALGSQPTLSRWENSAGARDLVRLSDIWCAQFIRLCGDQVRRRGEILLDLDSTRRSHLRSTATQLFQRRLRAAHVPSHAHLRAPHGLPAGGTLATGKRLQSCSHRAHAAASSATFTGGFSQREDQVAR